MSQIPLVDLKARLSSVAEPVRNALERVLVSGRFILGPEVEGLEQEVAALCQAAQGVGVSSGTDALLLAMMGLDLGPGDEVIVTPMSFFASVGAIVRLGATPVFADIDHKSFNLDGKAAAERLTDKTKAVEVVHLFGQCADLRPLDSALSGRPVAIIEDAAQALGAAHGGRRAGSLGRVGCFSFFPTKNLGGLGDGGMVVTNDESLARRMRILRAHGASPKYYHELVGGNFRLDALQAAVLRAMLPSLPSWNEARRRNANRYDTWLEQTGLAQTGRVLPPWRDPEGEHIFHHYVLRVPHRRDELRGFLQQQGIATEVYYPLCLHLQPALAFLGYGPGAFPVAERAAHEVLALPIYPELSPKQQERVVEAIVKFFAD